ncbi:uncharacterized protein LOC144429541 [Styela clava]
MTIPVNHWMIKFTNLGIHLIDSPAVRETVLTARKLLTNVSIKCSLWTEEHRGTCHYLEDLKIGITLAIFNEDGKIPNRSELLKKSVRHGAIISATYLRKRLGMLSAPTAFPSFRVASSIVNSFTVAGLKNMDWLTCLPRYFLKPSMSLQNLSARLEPTVEKYLLNSRAI